MLDSANLCGLDTALCQKLMDLGFKLYYAASEIPNKSSHYTVEINMNGDFFSQKSEQNCFKNSLRFYQMAGEWYFYTYRREFAAMAILVSQSISIKIDDVAILNQLRQWCLSGTAEIVLDPEASQPIVAALETRYSSVLYHPLPMQKDTASCSLFALDFANQARKIDDLHLLCERAAKDMEKKKQFPMLEKMAEELEPKGIQVISWADLPPILFKNSQSSTFFDLHAAKNSFPYKGFPSFLLYQEDRLFRQYCDNFSVNIVTDFSEQWLDAESIKKIHFGIILTNNNQIYVIMGGKFAKTGELLLCHAIQDRKGIPMAKTETLLNLETSDESQALVLNVLSELRDARKDLVPKFLQERSLVWRNQKLLKKIAKSYEKDPENFMMEFKRNLRLFSTAPAQQLIDKCTSAVCQQLQSPPGG